MIKNLILATVLLMSVGFAKAEKKSKEYCFRNADFGMTMSEVKKSEENDPESERKDLLLYTDKLLGIKTHVMYEFVDDSFFRGTYIISEGYQNKNNFIDDYNKIKKALEEKYGKPFRGAGRTDIVWKNLFTKTIQKITVWLSVLVMLNTILYGVTPH